MENDVLDIELVLLISKAQLQLVQVAFLFQDVPLHVLDYAPALLLLQ